MIQIKKQTITPELAMAFFADAQKLPTENWYIQCEHIESFGKSFKTPK
jgi:hypothetical protein